MIWKNRHIGQSATQQPGRLSTPLLGRGWGRLFLLALLLLAGTRYAYAQAPNTGANPYLNSWHSYRVIVGSAANTREWDITNGTDTIHLFDAMAWVIVPALSGTNADITICFTDTVFSLLTPGWELLYREYAPLAPGTCVAARKFTIDLTENDFYLTLDANDTICKTPYDGIVCNWDTIDVLQYNTVITYTVTLHKDANYTINGWSFVADIDLTPVGHNHTITDYDINLVAGEHSGAAILNNTSPYKADSFRINLTGLTPSTRQTVTVDIVITLRGLLYEGVTSTLNVWEGQATHGVNSNITYDNEGRPTAADGISDIELQDRLKVIVVDPLPATRNILAGAGETTWSSLNPLQNSTHRYTVTMGDVSNLTNSSPDWYITTETGTPVDPANYTLVQSQSATNDTATITFSDLMATGDYVLYFIEAGDNSCSTIREFPFTLGDPFDVDIAALGDDCSGANGLIYSDVTSEETTIVYTVDLRNTTYEETWQFNLELTCTELGGTLTAPSGDISVSGGTLGAVSIAAGIVTIPVVVTKTAGVDVSKEVQITVVYSGIYATGHVITATLVPPAIPGSFGSYGEVDVDDGFTIDGGGTEGQINQARHTIYAMPQSGILAGVD